MNSTEREQLSQFLQQLVQAQAGPKDVEAESLISRAMALQPDAAYLLVQRALLQDAGLKLAQQQAAALQEEIAQLKQATPARAAGGFLDANAWGRAPVAGAAAVAPGSIGSQVNQAGPAAAAPYAAQTPAYPPAQPAPAQAAPASGFQAPSFLTSMATTAAGVAAGAFLFQGLGHLMGGHQNNTGASAFGLSGPQTGNSLDGNALGNTSQPSEVINNYFESPTAAGASADRGDDRLLDTSDAAGYDFDSAGLDADPSSDDWA